MPSSYFHQNPVSKCFLVGALFVVLAEILNQLVAMQVVQFFIN